LQNDVKPYHWKLGLRQGHWHVGEVHWSKYASDLLQHLVYMTYSVTHNSEIFDIIILVNFIIIMYKQENWC